MFRNPDADRLRALLREVRTIAVVGLSPKPDRPSHGVSRSMQSFGYRIVPVNPGQAAILGETCYATFPKACGQASTWWTCSASPTRCRRSSTIALPSA